MKSVPNRSLRTGVSGEQGRSVKNDADAGAGLIGMRVRLNLRNHVLQEQERPVIDARQSGAEAAVIAFVVVLFFYKVILRLPFHAEGRVGEHVIELLAGKGVEGLAVAERVAVLDFIDLLAFDQDVGAADGVGFGVLVLPEDDEFGVRIQLAHVLGGFG